MFFSWVYLMMTQDAVISHVDVFPMIALYERQHMFLNRHALRAHFT